MSNKNTIVYSDCLPPIICESYDLQHIDSKKLKYYGAVDLTRPKFIVSFEPPVKEEK